jgi:tRNA threonylcarbamoyladenosine biosynthesis protein TsaE
LGRRIGKSLKKGNVIALQGELGSGKTQLVKGIASGLGIEDTITSPTYTIISEYTAADNVPFYHIDAYRLKDEDDFLNIGGNELLSGGGICVIEWSCRIAGSLPPDTITVKIGITGAETRVIQIEGLKLL